MTAKASTGPDHRRLSRCTSQKLALRCVPERRLADKDAVRNTVLHDEGVDVVGLLGSHS